MYKIDTLRSRDNCEDQKQKEITCNNRTLLCAYTKAKLNWSIYSKLARRLNAPEMWVSEICSNKGISPEGSSGHKGNFNETRGCACAVGRPFFFFFFFCFFFNPPSHLSFPISLFFLSFFLSVPSLLSTTIVYSRNYYFLTSTQAAYPPTIYL